MWTDPNIGSSLKLIRYLLTLGNINSQHEKCELLNFNSEYLQNSHLPN